MKNQSRLLRDIIDILNAWDPIGVYDLPPPYNEQKDEYNSYSYDLLQMVLLRKHQEEFFNYLWYIETEHMGMDGNKTKTKKFATKLAELAQ